MIKHTLFALGLLFSALTNAQETDFCTSHSLSDAVLNSDPAAKAEYDRLIQKYQDYTHQQKMLRTAPPVSVEKVIPVVFHIIHDYNSGNISDEQVASAIDNINLDFQKLNSDTIDIVSDFVDIAADLNLSFRLAKIDPQGNCTKGVTRTYSPLTHTAGENVKALVKWDPSKYLNVWIVETIASGAGGYSYLPGSAPGNDNNAGILVINSQFGATGTSNGSGFSKHTLSHEIGHYLGLPHTWGGTNTPGLPGNCGTDDGIDDTPECLGQSFNCDLTIETCGSLDNVQNFMCYAGCPNMFTEGQGDQVHFYLDNHISGNAPRNNLWQQANLEATGTNDGYVNQECTPIVDIYAEVTTTCVGEEIEIGGFVHNVDSANYNWTTPGSSSASVSGSNVYATYSSPGIYTVTLEVSNSAGSTIANKTDYIVVRSNSDQASLPYYEGFESTLSLNDPLSGSSWFTSGDYTETWETATVGYNSSNSYKARTKSFDAVGQSILELPFVDFTNSQSGTKLFFRYAYKQRHVSIEDKLIVYISKNCGKTWSQRKTIQIDNLITSPGTQNSTWTPQSSSDWKETSVGMTNVSGDPGILIRIVLEGEGGNYVYIDGVEIHNFNIGIEETTLDENALGIYPNPITNESVIEINSEIGRMYNLNITNVLGQVVYSHSNQVEQTKEIVPIPTQINNGMYFINLNIDGKHATKKVQVQR